MHHLAAWCACTPAIGQQYTNIKNPTEGLLHKHGDVFYLKEGLDTVYVTMVKWNQFVVIIYGPFFQNKPMKRRT